MINNLLHNISFKGIKYKHGYIMMLFCTCIFVLQFLLYIFHSQILDVMDFGGWAFYITSCISHAACLALLPFIIFSILYLVKLRRAGIIILIALNVLMSFAIHINEQVYQLYRFHINGFVINMITGPAAGEIFNFDTMLYVKYGLYSLLIFAIYAVGWWLCRRNTPRPTISISLCILIGSTLFAHLYHIYAAFIEKPSVIMSERLLPYYFPTTSYGLMTKAFGLKAPVHANTDIGTGNGDMVYPLRPLKTEAGDRPNVLFIFLDSWNKRSLTQECMPNVYRYAQENWWFQNHVSCSNGTRSSIFGLFFGISSYYWNIAESNHITPVILDVARQEGYKFHNYPSASQMDPPFGRVLFAKEKGVRIDTPGKNAYDRDIQITNDFISDLKKRKKGDAPFFSFLFYDLPHSFEYIKDKVVFLPSWEYADFSILNNDTDTEGLWNLYRNTCHIDDELIGEVFAALKECGYDENTLIVISGDHGQELNENKKNYWCHNGNFSQWQIGIPLIVHIPGSQPAVYKHRTTHYDIVPTVMRRAFGVTNPESDYSMGHQLTDTQSREWHVVGSELNYAFIIAGDTILEKTAEGSLDVYDAKMNMVSGYHIDATAFKKATDRLNAFIKQ